MRGYQSSKIEGATATTDKAVVSEDIDEIFPNSEGLGLEKDLLLAQNVPASLILPPHL